VCGFLLLFVAIFVPELDGPHSRQRAHEAASASLLSSVNGLQRHYAAAHPKQGFACELSLLKSSEHVKDSEYDPQEFLVSGRHSGYSFAILNCRAAANGVVDHYDVIAVPVEPGKSGFRAFCSNESGLLWYDNDGSLANCLASRRLVE
jgi:hypothetical protein